MEISIVFFYKIQQFLTCVKTSIVFCWNSQQFLTVFQKFYRFLKYWNGFLRCFVSRVLKVSTVFKRFSCWCLTFLKGFWRFEMRRNGFQRLVAFPRPGHIFTLFVWTALIYFSNTANYFTYVKWERVQGSKKWWKITAIEMCHFSRL